MNKNNLHHGLKKYDIIVVEKKNSSNEIFRRKMH